jgi:Transposase DDE domain
MRQRERTREAAFFQHQRSRRKIEALFGELKNRIGLRRVQLRRLKHVREQFLMAAVAQNLKRLVRYLASETPSSNPQKQNSKLQQEQRFYSLEFGPLPSGAREFFNSHAG